MIDVAQRIRQALDSYDRATDREGIERAERQRAEALQRFPLDSWPQMPLERYAVGLEDSTGTFCYWMEFGTVEMGSIRGGLIAFHRPEDGRHPPA